MASSVQNGKLESKGRCMCLRVCNMWCWRGCKWLPVLLIMAVVVWAYYAYVIELCFKAIESKVEQCIDLIVFHILLIMFLWSYWQTILAEIQPIPKKYKLPEEELQKLLSADTEEAQRAILENFAKDLPVVTRTSSGSVRYCNRCVLVKPDRAHHCSICSRCVLKMDHHCPWVNNCVCYHNYKCFMLFLGYALFFCLFIMLTCLPYFIKFWKGEFGIGLEPGRYHILFAFFLSMMFGVALGSLFFYHCYLVLHNRTTLEAFRAPMFRGGPDKNGFSMGAYNNFKEVFGRNPNLWLLPIFTSLGDGSDFPVRPEHHLQTFTSATSQEPRYDSMGTTRSSFGDGIEYPLPIREEDAESLLSVDRWERWEERPRLFDERESSSYDEL